MATYYGTDWSETIHGGSGHDVIYGYGGNDELFGHGGDDLIYGGAGHDDIYGGSGVNDLIGGSGQDWFYMSPRQLGGGFSDDLIRDFTLGEDRIDVSAWGVSDFSQLQALLTTDAYGDATLNALFDDYDHMLTLQGVAPGQLISSDFIYSTSGPRNVYGTSWADVLFGSSGDDRIEGGGGDDVLLGGGGDDDLIGGAGADRMVGGAGLDLVDYSGSWGGVTVWLTGATGSGGHAQGDTLESIEMVTGSNYGDALIGSSADNHLWGGGGHDYLEGGAGDDRLYGEDGNDDLVGGAGADRLDGGAGVDLADYSDSAAGVTVRLNGAASSGGDAEGDVLSSIEIVVGSDFADRLIGTAAAEELDGGAGDDILVGGGGGDVLIGGAGVDTGDWSALTADITASAASGYVSVGGGVYDRTSGLETWWLGGGDDIFVSWSGATTVRGGAGDDWMADYGASADLFEGGAGDDSLYGLAGDDVLLGGDGVDLVIGGAGDDILVGGAGGDWMRGDAGADTFRFDSWSDIAWDAIAEFDSGVDRIDLSGLGVSITGAFTGVAGQMIIQAAAPGSTYLRFDMDGNGVADHFIYVTGEAPVAGDFILGAGAPLSAGGKDELPWVNGWPDAGEDAPAFAADPIDVSGSPLADLGGADHRLADAGAQDWLVA